VSAPLRYTCVPSIAEFERLDAQISDDGIQAMAIRPSFAVLLPTTAYVLRLTPPPARKLIENGVPVALGSDYNPNAHCMSMPHVMNLACVMMRMTMNEALAAATINSAGTTLPRLGRYTASHMVMASLHCAASLGKSATHGSLEPGKFADMVVIDAPLWEHVIYQLCDPPIAYVIKKGAVVYQHSA